MKARKRFNPFYVLLVLIGIVFCITACAYGVMAVKQLHATQDVWTVPEDPSGFVDFMDRQGAKLLLVELVLLAVATVAAIGTDHFWEKS